MKKRTAMEAINKDYSNSRISEAEVIRRILRGEKELYEILLRRNNQKLYRVIRSYLHDEQEIEDLMQETYLKAYEKLSGFRQASSFSTWLIRIGINKALARLKEKGKLVRMDQNSPDQQSRTQRAGYGSMNPEKQIMKNEIKQLLETAIDRLDDKYRVVYMLKEVEGMPVEEVAACLGLSPSNIKVRLHRARHMLREKLYELSGSRDIFEFGFSRCDRITERVIRMIR